MSGRQALRQQGWWATWFPFALAAYWLPEGILSHRPLSWLMGIAWSTLGALNWRVRNTVLDSRGGAQGAG